ncbi:MAG TPA: hypothetical protein VNT26_16510 [Candidatus Sulfotelmatobacter sp.]|nr:hypothetical protein [Candidatus Sulfotelmatobacter sp.]
MSSAQIQRTPTRWQRAGPVITLLLAAPVLSELLSGSTRVSTLFVLVPSTGVWGCAALLIREAVRRRNGPQPAILLLGLALAIAEECLIQQTSLAPVIGMAPDRVYGRALGVNWVYFLWALGFESVWAVVLPIALVELLFPERRDEPWLGRRGVWISAAVFLLASLVAWFSWTQVFLPKFFPKSVYRVPLVATGCALAVIAGLMFVATRLKPDWRPEGQAPCPLLRPWLTGAVAFALALPWYLQVLLAFGAAPRVPPAAALLGGVALASGAFWVLQHWSGTAAWSNAHRLSLICGALLATLVGGAVTLTVGKALLLDRIGQVGFNLVALLCLFKARRALPPAGAA